MTLQIFIHNVGLGQAVHAFTPNGQTVAIDLGCSQDFSPLKWLKDQTQTIDSLIITHPHGDHIDEILEIENLDLNVRQLWRPTWLPEKDVRKANQDSYKEKLDRYFSMSDKKYTETVPEERRVGNPKVSGGVSIKKYTSSSCGTSNINNHSGVVVFEYLNCKIIVPGDNENPSWNVLLENQYFVNSVKNADLFVASHHGRESGHSSDLMKIVTPSLCIVSDGAVQETDARDRYSNHASGWPVHNRSKKTSNDRKCLTTRTDGPILIEVGENPNGGAYFSVSTF